MKHCTCHDPTVFGHNCHRPALTFKAGQTFTIPTSAFTQITQAVNQTNWDWQKLTQTIRTTRKPPPHPRKLMKSSPTQVKTSQTGKPPT